MKSPFSLRISRFFIAAVFLSLVLPMSGVESPVSRLETMLREARFSELPALFADSSYAVLTAYCREAHDLRLVEEKPGEVTGYIKFPRHAEIVRLTFQSEQARLSGLELTRVLYPLEYIRGFFAVDSRSIKVARGDARLRMQAGKALVAGPFARLLLFVGSGDFLVAPADEEERLTLRRLRGGPEMTADFDSLLFLSDAKFSAQIIESDSLSGESAPLAAAHRELLERFNRQFGIFVPGFKEHWYPRFSNQLNLMIFKEPQGAVFHYQYNPAFVPDTTLLEMPGARYLLSYNRESGMKMSLNAPDRLEKLELQMMLDPATLHVQATSRLLLQHDTGFMRFLLNPAMTVHSVFSSDEREIELFSPGGFLRYLRGERMRDITIRYSGKIEPDKRDVVPRGDDRFGDPRRDWDPYILWNRDNRYYPGPEAHGFQEATVRVSLPSRYRCLVSGRIESETVAAGRRMVSFHSPAVKGLGLVCGDFFPRTRVEAAVAVEVYAARDLVMQRKIEISDIKPAIDFLVEAYGLPTSRVINMVLRRWHEYGGISNQGLVVLNVPGPRESRKESMRRRIMGNRPVIITDLYRDSLVHELAHQWWGGEVSWSSYRDIWITEGLAQFSTLIFHKNRLSDRAYAAAVRNMKRWVMRHSDAGPPVYGLRIRNLGAEVEVMQSVVYNRSALVFAMLTEILGEKEVFRRLRMVLDKKRYQDLTSSQFIAAMSKGSPRLKRFFTAWIYTRRLPRLTVASRFAGNAVSVDLTQDADFVFPLRVEVSTRDGMSFHPVVMETKRLHLSWREKSRVRKVKVKAGYTPVVFN